MWSWWPTMLYTSPTSSTPSPAPVSRTGRTPYNRLWRTSQSTEDTLMSQHSIPHLRRRTQMLRVRTGLIGGMDCQTTGTRSSGTCQAADYWSTCGMLRLEASMIMVKAMSSCLALKICSLANLEPRLHHLLTRKD